jgi:hypothetical protein
MLLNCRNELSHLIALGLTVIGLEIEHERQLRVYQDVVTAATAGQLIPKGVRKPEQVLETDIEVALLDPRPGFAGTHISYLNLETATSLEVMNSSSAGSPRSVAAMPRRIAGTISAGSVMRSP